MWRTSWQSVDPQRLLKLPGVFALIIGIDEYADRIPHLKGCVNDAKSIKDFLVNHFKVPKDACVTSTKPGVFVSDTGDRYSSRPSKSQIVVLLNKAATRDAIIANLEHHLIENRKIPKDTPIVIFFAGHGSRPTAPVQWGLPDGAFEAICPYDTTVTLPVASGTGIKHVIPDRTLGTLLHGLAAKQGNNITVILDSCHSGGAARALPPGILPQPRRVEVRIEIPFDLDWPMIARYYSGRRGLQASEFIPPGFRYEFMRSHVLLAACRQDQQARECETGNETRSGIFTKNLVTELRALEAVNLLDTTTYSDLHHRLPSQSDQIPQCDGQNKSRLLFRTKEPARTRFPLIKTRDGGLTVEIGTFHGVGHETEFLVQHPNPDPNEGPIILIPRKLDTSAVLLQERKDLLADQRPTPAKGKMVTGRNQTQKLLADRLPKGTMVTIHKWNKDKLKIYLSWSSRKMLTKLLFSRELEFERNFMVTDRKEEAGVHVSRSDNTLVIERQDEGIRTQAIVRWSESLESRLPLMFNAVAHFDFFIHRDFSKSGDVTVEMYRLKGEPGSFVPTGKDLFAGDKHHAIIRHENDALYYGFALNNYMDVPVFPYLFYFDPIHYTIDVWYSPPARNGIPQLLSGAGANRMTIGYGTGGGFPLEFTSSQNGAGHETGFVKLFVSTVYMELDWIKQGKLDSIDFPRPIARRFAFSTVSTWTGKITLLG